MSQIWKWIHALIHLPDLCVIRSLNDNQLCGVNRQGVGTFTLDAINAICDALTKSNVQSIR